MIGLPYQPEKIEERFVFRRGEKGYAIWCIQVALNTSFVKPGLREDGDFGPMTEGAVRTLQAHLGIKTDGVMGPETMRALVKRACLEAEKGVVPGGISFGIISGESNCNLAATSAAYEDDSRDYGPAQDHLGGDEGPLTMEDLRNAYNVGYQAHKVCEIVRKAFLELRNGQAVQGDRGGWELAVLFYNWQVAARRISEGRRYTWEYTTNKGTKGPYKLDTPDQPWVAQWKIVEGTSGWAWCQHYIKTKTIGPDPTHPFVTSWTV